MNARFEKECKHENTHIGYGYMPKCVGIGGYTYCDDCNKTIEYNLDYSSCSKEEIKIYEKSEWFDGNK